MVLPDSRSSRRGPSTTLRVVPLPLKSRGGMALSGDRTIRKSERSGDLRERAAARAGFHDQREQGIEQGLLGADLAADRPAQRARRLAIALPVAGDPGGRPGFDMLAR